MCSTMVVCLRKPVVLQQQPKPPLSLLPSVLFNPTHGKAIGGGGKTLFLPQQRDSDGVVKHTFLPSPQCWKQLWTPETDRNTG